MINILLNNKHHPDIKDTYSLTPLSWAAVNKHETVIRILLVKNIIDPNFKDINDRTPLSWAAEINKKIVIELLLKHKLDINEYDKLRRTLLYYTLYHE